MPSARFTARWAEALKPPVRGQVDYFDANRLGPNRHFGLRVSAGGRKAWIVLYRAQRGGSLQRITLGTFPPLGLADARELAEQEVSKRVLDGGDPAKERRERREAPTFGELADAYLEQYAKPRKRSWRRDEEIIERDLRPAWDERKALDITRRDVRELLEGIQARGAPVGANRALEVARKMFNWALDVDGEDLRHPVYHLEANPCARVARVVRERRRDRVLSTDEIRKLWTGLDATRITEPVRLVLRLMLVTAQRKGEVIGAERSELDLKARWWTIPGERSKNGLPHRVPLSQLAADLWKRSLELSPSERYLFPSRTGDRPILGTAVDRAARRNRERLKVADWTPHDLRRTAASYMTSAGISRLVVQKLLNHAERDVTAVYDRHSYDREKRQALDVWARKLGAIIEGKSAKVVELVR